MGDRADVVSQREGTMDADYPAAHSMDTHWFAVDQDGHVALFFTAESGFMPEHADAVEGPELIELYQVLAGQKPPGLDEEGMIDDWNEFLGAFGDLGFFEYDLIGSFGDPEELFRPYTLTCEPEEKPLHVDQLPAEWRARCGSCRFATVSFGDGEHLQPFEQVSGEWYAWWDGSCAYLSSDQKTVRPIPGREEKFGRFCRTHADKLKEEGWQSDPRSAPGGSKVVE